MGKLRGALVVGAALAAALLGGCSTETPVSGEVVDKHVEHAGAELEYELVVKTPGGEKHIFEVTERDWRRYSPGQQLNSNDLEEVTG